MTTRRHVVALVSLSPLLASAAAAPVIGRALVPPNGAETTLEFDVPASGDESYFHFQFSLRGAFRGARLVPPGGAALRLRVGDDLARLEAARRPDPGRGDVYIGKRPVIDPVPGRWRLELEHAPLPNASIVEWQVVVLSRFALDIEILDGVERRVGNALPVIVSVTDYGLPLELEAPSVTAVGPGRARRELAVVDARTPRVQPRRQAGTFVATLSPWVAGAYGIEARAKVRARDGRPIILTASTRLEVQSQQDLRRSPLAFELLRQADGCWREARWSMPWHAQQPGIYTLSLKLAGREQDVFVNGSVDCGRPGPIELVAVLRAERARRVLAAEVRELASLAVQHTGNDVSSTLLLLQAVVFEPRLELRQACSS